MMANVLILRFAIQNCLFLGGLLAIIAIFKSNWQKYAAEDQFNAIIVNAGLWEYCTTHYPASLYQHNQKQTRCGSVNDILNALHELKSMNLFNTKKNIKKVKSNYFFV